MNRFPQPFYRRPRKRWFVQLDGRQINLGPDRDHAYQRYHALMAEYTKKPRPGLSRSPPPRHPSQACSTSSSAG